MSQDPLVVFVYQTVCDGKVDEPTTSIRGKEEEKDVRRLDDFVSPSNVAIVEFPKDLAETVEALRQLDRATGSNLRNKINELMQFAYQQGRKHVLAKTTQ